MSIAPVRDLHRRYTFTLAYIVACVTLILLSSIWELVR